MQEPVYHMPVHRADSLNYQGKRDEWSQQVQQNKATSENKASFVRIICPHYWSAYQFVVLNQ